LTNSLYKPYLFRFTFIHDQCIMSTEPEHSQQFSEGPSVKSGGIAGSDGSTPKRKRTLKVHAIEKKFYAITAVEKGLKSKSIIAMEFEIPLNTLSTWLKSADKIKESMLLEGGKET